MNSRKYRLDRPDISVLPLRYAYFGDLSYFAASDVNIGRALAMMYSAKTVEVTGKTIKTERVIILSANVDGSPKRLYVKEDAEPAPMEAHAIALHNLVAKPIVYAAYNRGHLLIVEEIPGQRFDYKFLEDDEIARNYGRAAAVAEFIGLSDRHKANLILDGNEVRHVDFELPFEGNFFQNPLMNVDGSLSYRDKRKIYSRRKAIVDGHDEAVQNIRYFCVQRRNDIKRIITSLRSLNTDNQEWTDARIKRFLQQHEYLGLEAELYDD
ncbi:MAG: hypothetical protein HYT71_03405 [Candidatus Aenigmarchaeota archaeon]|nr:hypothetical protein [Candidatus Aenigmarchaeota archaeon]